MYIPSCYSQILIMVFGVLAKKNLYSMHSIISENHLAILSSVGTLSISSTLYLACLKIINWGAIKTCSRHEQRGCRGRKCALSFSWSILLVFLGHESFQGNLILLRKIPDKIIPSGTNCFWRDLVIIMMHDMLPPLKMVKDNGYFFVFKEQLPIFLLLF